MRFPFQISSSKQSNLIQIGKKVKLYFIVLITIGFNACQNNKQRNTRTTTEKDSLVALKTDSTENIQPKEMELALALSANAIQIIDQNNGSAKEIGFDTPFDQTVEIVEKVLKSKPTVGINSECGAGPLKMATWDNGLTLLFREKKNDGWLFVGWAANQAKNPQSKLNTMASIGIGSTRKEMESAYVVNVVKTTLGYEFSTKSNDLFGIFDGANENATITNLWSGVSCNFR